MPLVQFDKDLKDDFPIFNKAGVWGQYGDFEAQCVIENYEFPSQIQPPWVTEGSDDEDTPFALFSLLCVREGAPNIRENLWTRTGQAWRIVEKLGIEVGEDGSHDTAAVTGLSCQIVCGEPKESKKNAGQFFSAVKTVLPIPGV